MKFKNLSLIAGAFTKCAPCALALTLTAVPFSVKAETTSQAPVRLAQNQPTKPNQRGSIQLTPKQQTEIEQIRGNVRKQIEDVLTKEQRTQIKTAMEAGKPAREAFAALTFTPKQQTELQQIMVSSQQQMEAVLTSDQKAELARLRQQNTIPGTQPKK